MTVLYMLFARLRTVFCIFLAIFMLGGLNGHARADDALYTVSDVTVDVTAEDALKAREQAFGEAQQEAFKRLAERMTSEGQAGSMEIPDLAAISSLIQDFEVTQEKLSSVRYVGTYTFRFNDRAVRNYFGQRGVSYTDVSSRPVLVLPFYQAGGRSVLWSPNNDWMKAWGRAGNLQGLVPLLAPLGDLMDVSDIGDDEALNYDPAKLANMLARYDAGEAALLIAIPDPMLAQAAPDDEAVGTLTVQIYRTDRRGPEAVRGVTLQAQGGETKTQMMDRAVREVQQALQRNWKEKTIVATQQRSSLQVLVHFANLQEWAETQRALERIPGVSGIELRSLSPQQARVTLLYHGDEVRLRLALQQANMTLTEPRFNSGGLKYGVSSEPLTYELYLNNLRRRDGGY